MAKTILCFLLMANFILAEIMVKDDNFIGFFNQFYHKLTDDTGRTYELPANTKKLELLKNDIFYPDQKNTCVEKKSSRPVSDEEVTGFKEIAQHAGFHHVHRNAIPSRPFCQFDYVILGRGNVTDTITNELCVMEMLTGGAAVGDYDDDGFLDVFFTVYNSRSLLYKNNGDGTFTDVTAIVNVGPERFGNGAGWIDVDSDGDLDLYVTTVGDKRHYLYINQGGYFTEEAVERGVSLQFENNRKLAGFTPNFGDFNNDGFIDIHVSEWMYHSTSGKVSACRLFKNMGHDKPGHFVDVTDSAGVNMDSYWTTFRNKFGSGTHTFGSSFTDFDNDGWQDLLITGDFGQSKLFWNNRNETFTLCEGNCVGAFRDGMGNAVGDINNDGYLDSFITGVYWTEKSCRLFTCAMLGVGNGLFLNNHNRSFIDATDQSGIRNGYWAWGGAFMDFDNDGYLDIVLTNGFDAPSTTLDDEYGNANMQLFHNQGEGTNNTMKDVAATKGIDFFGLGRGLLVWDFDNDGDEDILVAAHVGPPMLFQNNEGNKKNYLRIKVLHRCLTNAKKLCNSYGARVTVTSKSGRMQTSLIGSKTHFLGQSELTAHFGLGQSSEPVKVVVVWAQSKKKITLNDVKVNQVVSMVEPEKNEEIKNWQDINECPYLEITDILEQPTEGTVSINADGTSVAFNSGQTSLFDIGVQHFQYKVKAYPMLENVINTNLVGIVTLDFRANIDIYPTCDKNGRPEVAGMMTMEMTDERRLDGFSNNKDKVQWGSIVEDLPRLAPHAYADNISEPAGACTAYQSVSKTCPYPEELSGIGSNRPSPRLISNILMSQTIDHFSRRNLSDFTMHYGQFLSHDTDHSTPLPRYEFQYHANHVWMPITIPKGDVHFDPFSTGKETMGFVRSSFNRCTGHYPGEKPRAQFNQLSAYLDANTVYGSTLDRCGYLREYKNGRLRLSDNLLLPKNDASFPNENPIGRPPKELYLAGDIRANVQPGLMSIHVLFVREHNRLAQEYHLKHPLADDEEIFQKARRLLIAEIQAITYNEYLPAILGGIHHIPKYTGYNKHINPEITNEFSTAAFRFGHSQVNSLIFRLEEDYTPIKEGHALLREMYFKPNRLEKEGGVDPIFRGAIYFPAQEVDLKMVDEMRNTLFPTSAASPGKETGFDLASLNIQRGRDHGLADLNTVRKSIGLKAYETFEEITTNTDIANKLKLLYKDLNNIDLWIGGLAEDHVKNSELGETFHTIMVEQFVRLRDGDRFWYQNNLTNEEIKMVEETTLGKIIKLNTGFDECPKHVFFSLQKCIDVKDHQCVPRQLSDAKYAEIWSHNEQLITEKNQDSKRIKTLIIIACVFGGLAFILIMAVLKLILANKRVEKPKEEIHSQKLKYTNGTLELGHTKPIEIET